MKLYMYPSLLRYPKYKSVNVNITTQIIIQISTTGSLTMSPVSALSGRRFTTQIYKYPRLYTDILSKFH